MHKAIHLLIISLKTVPIDGIVMCSHMLQQYMYNTSSVTVFNMPSHSFQCQYLSVSQWPFNFSLGNRFTVTSHPQNLCRHPIIRVLPRCTNCGAQPSHEFSYCPSLQHLWTLSTLYSHSVHFPSLWTLNQQSSARISHTLSNNSGFDVTSTQPP